MSDLNDPRVLFAAERTLLAWNRTSLGLIGLGFVLERTRLLHELVEQTQINLSLQAPTFIIGLSFILLGALSAAVSSRQYIVFLKTLKPTELPFGYSARWALVTNIAVALLGIALAVVLYIWND